MNSIKFSTQKSMYFSVYAQNGFSYIKHSKNEAEIQKEQFKKWQKKQIKGNK